jgi:hypothetical protein
LQPGTAAGVVGRSEDLCNTVNLIIDVSDVDLMRSAAQAGVEDPHTSPYQFFSFFRNAVSVDVFLRDIPEEQIDVGVIELRCNHETHTFYPALVDKIMMHKDAPGSLQNSDALSACLEINFCFHILQVYFLKKFEDFLCSPEYLKKAACSGIKGCFVNRIISKNAIL